MTTLSSRRTLDAVLLVGFGGPEGQGEVLPFLKSVLRGRPVPPARLKEVAEHYRHFGGVSPINGHCRALRAAIETHLAEEGPALPVYWGNLHWNPGLEDVLREMRDDGVREAAAFVTSAYAGYSSCRKYIEALEAARFAVGDGAPTVHKLRTFYDHPGFIEPMAALLREEVHGSGRGTRVVFTAHSVPLAMPGCDAYVGDLEETCRLVAERALDGAPFDLVFQSRSGRPGDRWLEPDILAHLEALSARGVTEVVVGPVGFLSDHMEVVWDLDAEAKARAVELGLAMRRAPTVGTHPRFVAMVRELLVELTDGAPVRALGDTTRRASRCGPACCVR